MVFNLARDKLCACIGALVWIGGSSVVTEIIPTIKGLLVVGFRLGFQTVKQISSLWRVYQFSVISPGSMVLFIHTVFTRYARVHARDQLVLFNRFFQTKF